MTASATPENYTTLTDATRMGQRDGTRRIEFQSADDLPHDLVEVARKRSVGMALEQQRQAGPGQPECDRQRDQTTEREADAKG